MSETNKETFDQAATDPPDNNGGTDGNAALLDGASSAVDPPDNNGGTGGKTTVKPQVN